MATEKEQEGAVANSSDALSVPKARVLAEVFAPNGKIRVELLPPEVAGGSAEGGSVNLQPLEERVAALENAPKAADKSQEVTALQGDVSTLQGTVAEHTTNIASNVQRITALESRPPESVNLQPLNERVTALEGKANILGEDGKVKADLLPDSCKGGHCEAQTLPSDVVRTADIADVVRKSALFDTEHNMILPELIPKEEVAVKWLKGKGRPDKPETTEGVITGHEWQCRYLSTDGAGTGAWEWEERDRKWHVVRGDTGWRYLRTSALPDAYISFRRIGNVVHVGFAGGTNSVFKVNTEGLEEYDNSRCGHEGYKLMPIPEGFDSEHIVSVPLANWDPDESAPRLVVGEIIDKVSWIVLACNPDKNTPTDFSDLPCVEFTYITNQEWPSSLPGDPEFKRF